MCINSLYMNGDVCHYFFSAPAEEQDCVNSERVPSAEQENDENENESQPGNADHQNDFEETTDAEISYTTRCPEPQTFFVKHVKLNKFYSKNSDFWIQQSSISPYTK